MYIYIYIYIRIAETSMNLSIIQVYAPTADYEDDIIDEFYEQIQLQEYLKRTL